jgi:biotin transport system ATP-binding protein
MYYAVVDPGKNVGATRIEVASLSYHVHEHSILNHVDFEFQRARLGIIGRNGSGKSTLARILAGLVEPTSGQVRINGSDMYRDRKAALSEVGILFQNPDHQIIFPTVLEEVAFGLTQKGIQRSKATAAARITLASFGKAHWAESYVNVLSHGQKHLLCMMAIVAMAPRVLILDEPFAGLDIPTKRQLYRYLEKYNGTVLHITHDPEDLSGYQDVIWLDQGAIKKAGAAPDVLPAYLAEMERLGSTDDISDLAY